VRLADAEVASNPNHVQRVLMMIDSTGMIAASEILGVCHD